MAKILVVDDEVQIRDLIRKALELKGCEVKTAPRVDQALAMMEQEAFDLVLTDINMPGESGLEFLKKIRQSQKKTPVVVYSGSITPDLDKELREAGANEVLKKDAGVNTLTEQIGKIAKAKDRIFTPPLAAHEKTILIVDDQESVRKLLVSFFKPKGYNLVEADCGEKAIEWLAHKRPSVVLLDMMMPGMGGLAALKKIMEIHPGLGVLIMTATERDEESVKKALELGAYSYILKPFDFLYLNLVVTSKLLIAEGS